MPKMIICGRKPVGHKIRSSTTFITIVVANAVFTDIFLYAIIVPVFPFSLVERAGVHPDNVQHWLAILLSVYGAALLVTAPICGYLSDKVEYRKTPLIAGLLALGGATIMLCLARSLPLIVVGRVLQGSSAGVIWVVGLALLADTVGRDEVGQYMGYVGTAYSLSALLAPLLGGIVYEYAGYYQVFAMAFGMIGLDLTLRLLLIEKKAARKWLVQTEPIRISPTVDSTETEKTTSVLCAPPTLPETANENEKGDVPALVALTKKRLPPILILLKSRRMQAVFWASTVDAMVFTSFDTTLPLFVEKTFHWKSLGAGLIFLAVLTPSFFSPIFGALIDRFGPRYFVGGGLLLTVPPWVCLRFVTHDSLGQKVLLCALLAVIGLGVCVCLGAVMVECTVICAEKEEKDPGSMGKNGAYAQGYGLFNVSWALGSLIGAYWSAGIREAAGWGTMTWTVALLCAVTSIPAFLFVDGWIGHDARKTTARKALRLARLSSPNADVERRASESAVTLTST